MVVRGIESGAVCGMGWTGSSTRRHGRVVISGRETIVAMMKSAHFRKRNNLSLLRSLHRPRFRGIFVQAQVGPTPVIIGEIRGIRLPLIQAGYSSQGAILVTSTSPTNWAVSTTRASLKCGAARWPWWATASRAVQSPGLIVHIPRGAFAVPVPTVSVIRWVATWPSWNR